MKCKCGENTQTKDTRKIDLGVWRKRVCPACGESFTTLEQVCVTAANPYRNGKNGKEVAGVIAPPEVPVVPRPNGPEKRSYATRKAARAAQPAKPKPTPRPPTGVPLPKADFAPPKEESDYALGRGNVPAVDRLTPTARDRIEDLKFQREMARDTYGWDSK